MKKSTAEIPAIIIAGGRGSRMGGVDKCLLTVGDKTILSHIVDRLLKQTSRIFLNTNSETSQFNEYNLPIIADQTSRSIGPLGGLHSAMSHLLTHELAVDEVLTVTGDSPFLPYDLLSQLSAAKKKTDEVVFCASEGRNHFITGLWSLNTAAKLEKFIHTGERSAQKFIATIANKKLHFANTHLDPFFNINTEQDLGLANSLYQSAQT